MVIYLGPVLESAVWGVLGALPFVIVFAAFRRARHQKRERQEEAEYLEWKAMNK